MQRFFLFLLPLLTSCTFAKKGESDAYNEYQWFKVFSGVYYIAKNYYVEEVSPKKLVINASKGILEKLDPYSEYYTKEELKEFEEYNYGYFGGIGVEISLDK